MLLLLLPMMVITGSTGCPTASAVDAQLRALVGDDSDSPSTARLEPDGAGVHLRLDGPDGHLLAERTLPAGQCDDLAHAAALLIAAWRTEFHLMSPSFRLRPPPIVRAPAPPRPAIEFDVAAAFSAAWAGTHFAPDGTIAATLGSKGARVRARIAVTAGGLRSLDVGTATGHTRFLRAGLSLGPDVRFTPRRFLIDLFAEATVAVLYLDAVGYQTNSSAKAFDVALGGGARAGLRLGRIAPFIGVRVAGWLTGQSVAVSGPQGGSTKIPPFELFLEAGLTFGRF